MYELTPDKEIQIGTKVQTLFGERWGRVVAIDEVEVLDTVTLDGGRITHVEPRYHVEVGQKDTDSISNFKSPFRDDKPFTLMVVRREIARAF